ncbi:MAG: hypothetical protein Q9160_007150 [Pyrenula sp. 1 TL-2023]
MTLLKSLLYFFLLLTSGLCVDPLVELSYSAYDGTPLSNGISQWLGIRYAAPPIANLRFEAPQDPIATDGVQTADAHGPICLPTPGTISPPDNTRSEDCLFLDVYAPSNATATSKLPVFFFIQGGGFNADSNPNFNGSGIVTASGYNVVVVTFNYRVGPYGFLAGQEVSSLNNGLKDQVKALEWVQSYITEFGGDPGHVVLGGDSAGAASITLLQTAYSGAPTDLFHAAAAESQSFATVNNPSQAQYQYNNLVIRTQCVDSNDTLACLKGLTAEQLQRVNINTASPGAQQAPLYMYSPVIDGELVPDYTYRLFAEGKFVKLPAIYGDDTNEGTIFVPESTANISDSDTFMQNQFPAITVEQLRTINDLFPNLNLTFPNSGPFWRQASNAYGEIRYICPGIFCSDAHANFSGTTTWNYRFAVLDPDQDAQGLGTPHTVEVNAIWGPDNVNGGAPASYLPGGINAGVVPLIQGYWTSFIRSYNPNTYRLAGSPEWQEWSVDGKQRLLFLTNGTSMESVPEDQRARCAYLSSIGVALRQ